MLPLPNSDPAVLASPPPAIAQAVATIRIERPAVANSKSWAEAPRSSRREIVIQDERGQRILVRLVDYQ